MSVTDPPTRPARRRPNLVICMCDQLRAHEVACYGNRYIRTPHLDRLAAEGTRFEHAVSNNPVCMPARSIVVAGQYSRTAAALGNVADAFTHGNTRRWLMPQYPPPGRPHFPQATLPELLRDAGYHTRAIGKWHIHARPDDIGFDRYLIPRVYHCHSAQLFTEDGGPEFCPDQWTVDYETHRVRQFLEQQRDSDPPFFLYYNISPPHCPVADAPERYLRMYAPGDVHLRPNVPVDADGKLPADDTWFKIYRYDFRHYLLALPYADQLPEGYDLRALIAEYAGLTTWVDDAVGALMAALEDTGLADDTVVVFCSDHGDMLGSHGRWQKGTLHEEAIRVPMIVRGPGVAAGAVNTEQVASLVDLAPTLLALAGVEPAGHLQGRSLAPVLRGQRAALDQPWAFIETGGNGIGIRTPTHLLGLPYREPGPIDEARHVTDTPHLFFDLCDDPYELANLAEGDAQPDVRAALTDALLAWHHQTPWRQGVS